ncbi:MAG: CPBP family intramembrane metalloprotease [Bacteroidetes bacterium]|nr:MAG: CPBP family intramembrane metalloprotease [Bacteroidota bacterium]
MDYKLFNQGYSGWRQLGVFLGIWGMGLIVGSLAAMAAWTAMTGQGLMNMQQDMLNPEFAVAIKVMQVITTLFVFFLPAVLYAKICWRPPALALGFRPGFSFKILGWCLLLLAASLPIIDLLTLANKAIPLTPSLRAQADALEASYEQQIKAIGSVENWAQYLSTLVLVAALPALFEEVMFRGGLQNLFARWWKKSIVAIVVGAIIFSLIHTSWYGFLPRVALGALLGLVFHYTRSIWYSIIIHFINNGVIITYLFITTKNGQATNLSDTIFPWWAGLVSVGIVLVILRKLKQLTSRTATEEIYFHNTNPFQNTIFNNLS